MNTFFIADLHFNHEGVIEMSNRPFVSVEEMNDALLDGINLTVAEDDRLFVLGDFGWHNEASHFEKIHCRNIHLIVGNHDRGRSIRLFKTVDDVRLLKIDGHKVFLSHYPHCFWPGSHHGSFHLYGHMHGQREDWMDEKLGDSRRSMDVGVDEACRMFGAYRPFSWAEVKQTLINRPGHDHVEWYRERRNRMKESGRLPLHTEMINGLERYRESRLRGDG